MGPFRQGVRELGYVEGQNITIECRGAPGVADRFAGFAAELVRLKVDVLVAGTSRAGHDSTYLPIYFLSSRTCSTSAADSCA
jgi:hypothetical protein